MPNTVIVLRSAIKGLFFPVCLVLVLQTAASHMLTFPERDLPLPGLRQLPMQLGKWKAHDEQALERNITEYLKPDEYVLRDYVSETAESSINLFVAYFKSLQNVYGPHSPRVCLPGSGWLVRSSRIETLQIPGRAQPIPLNEYSLQKSDQRLFVVYWYQNDRDIWAEEFHAKLKLLPDMIRYRRSDVSLVRLVMPMRGTSEESTLANCREFTRLVFPLLVDRFGATK